MIYNYVGCLAIGIVIGDIAGEYFVRKMLRLRIQRIREMEEHLIELVKQK